MDDRIVVQRLIAAPPSVVFSYLTDSEKWARWQGIGATIHAEPGGIFAISMPNGATARGEFVEIELDRRVVFTWGWNDHPGLPPGSTTVEIDLEAENGGTRLTLTHHGLPVEELPTHRMGWDRYLQRLVVVGEGGDPGPDVTAS